MKHQGLGSKMMALVTEYADTYNYPVYLENSKEENLRFYEKHGFVALERLQPFGDTSCLWRMLRPMKNPKRPAGERLSDSDVCC
ncbi:uncharacterized protein [Blastocystis hominis]|uniref:N-acetyltransferase domain-containing protein n=1 Tax=Blastocystis hominis TaxID=12968 RepID=D8M823_BLAHO|nr:uncharacterized protein [Blastocystis hominis]CBK24212.2 unnamed protein product [Blastocystis hominis]|eukprot:XP_012898260.1 uncharacterized protein [Blastocystis hominis]